MKKLLLLISVFFVWGDVTTFSQTGKNCFNTQFHENASNYDPVNAYLMGYLATMMYPDYGLRFWYSGNHFAAEGDSVSFLEAHDDKFVSHFSDKLGYLFIDKDAPLTLSVNAQQIATSVRPNNTALITASLSSLTPKNPMVVNYGASNGQSVTFDFVNKCNASGYDPEAMVISTSSTIYVVFRGTDRVGCTATGSFGYDWNEWLASDFKFQQENASRMGGGILGKVHTGMVESLLYQGFADSLASKIARYGAATKKVWITGHSLGGGHAQLFAMFLKHNYQIAAQGVYIYESPNPGDQDFVNQMNNDIGKNRIQRFEFSDDPIPTLPPQTFLFARAGVRNFFNDIISTVQRGKEQIPLIDDLKIFCAIGNLPSDEIPSLPVKLDIVGCGTVCYHDPSWVLNACKHQVSSSLYPSLPPDIPLPSGNCTPLQIAQGKQNNLVNNAADAFETLVENSLNNIAWTASVLTDNILDKAIAEGNYELVCYKFRNDIRNAIEWPWPSKNSGTAESKIGIASILNPGNNIFHIEHDALGLGYRISMMSGTNKKYYIEIPFFGNGDNGTLAQMQEYHPYDGQIWLFYKIPGTSVYVIYNKQSGKVLDAPDACENSASSCKVLQNAAANQDQSQLWLLKKIN
jgi:hypothetical protein